MLFHNGSSQVICVGDTLIGPPKEKAMVLKPGQRLNIPEICPAIVVEFVTTPDGLRMSIKEEGLILPWSDNHRIT